MTWRSEGIEMVEAIRGDVNRELERLKKEGAIRSGLEVDVGITWSGLAGSLLAVDKEGERLLGHVANEDLEDCLVCSNV